jgi:hypothetical protein
MIWEIADGIGGIIPSIAATRFALEMSVPPLPNCRRRDRVFSTASHQRKSLPQPVLCHKGSCNQDSSSGLFLAKLA